MFSYSKNFKIGDGTWSKIYIYISKKRLLPRGLKRVDSLISSFFFVTHHTEVVSRFPRFELLTLGCSSCLFYYMSCTHELKATFSFTSLLKIHNRRFKTVFCVISSPFVFAFLHEHCGFVNRSNDVVISTFIIIT